MSLSAHDHRSRGRSKSRTRDSRDERSRSRARPVSPPTTTARKQQPTQPKYEYASPMSNYKYASPPAAPEAPLSIPSPPRGYAQTVEAQYTPHIPGSFDSGPPSTTYAQSSQYTPSAQKHVLRDTDWNDFPPHERPGYVPPQDYKYAQPGPQDRSVEPGHAQHHMSLNTNLNLNYGHSSPQYGTPVSPTYAHNAPQYPYGQPTSPHGARPIQPIQPPAAPKPTAHYSQSTPSYEHPGQYPYTNPSQNHARPTNHRPSMSYNQNAQAPQPYAQNPQAQVIEIAPAGTSLNAPPSPNLAPRMHSLSVSGGSAGALTVGHAGHGSLGGYGGGLPPGSPLLEAYHGTYQSISPMPSPVMLPSSMDDGLDDLAPLSPVYNSDEEMRRRRKHVSVYDPSDDAESILDALKHSKIDSEPLIEILPGLTDEQVLELRTEYKKIHKLHGKGVNITAYIKMKVPGALGKVAYATALGRWEGEAHWANFYYQGNGTRRELLIESLMGRTNAEIGQIKEAFRDKKYSNSLEKCMKTELKADKFRVAVLLVLEEKRQEESRYLSGADIRRDVGDLYRALTAEKGGESAMIQIVVTRSDNHLREVLKLFEQTYRKNFAREMLKKSTNLVGELLAHILNGVINRPVRDALLLHQALAEEKGAKDRNELLISRLVRYHWDRPYLEKVKTEFFNRYRKTLEEEIEDGTKGDFG
ncbi:MAG: hypothetical protein M1812_007707 [Candelaria pacifica]|nr:MAG: hypothetical protein M1812_007707 [Candelaria pacifica]